MFCKRVVLPVPKKPDKMVIGIMGVVGGWIELKAKTHKGKEHKSRKTGRLNNNNMI
jgi:hypothetical protein